MTSPKTIISSMAILAALAILPACSKPQEKAAADTPAVAPAPAAAPAPATAAAPAADAVAAAPAAAPAAPVATAATATKVSLAIKDASGAPVSGDVESGKKVFQQCAVCHTTQPGVNKVGPSLHGIIGRHSGVIPNFRYSAANKASGITWTEQELYVYLENPQKTIPGTIMPFTGVKDNQKRADVIAYLQENTK
jgi:cytochrome c